MKNAVIKIILLALAAVPVWAQSGGTSRGLDVKKEQVRLSALRDIEKYSEDIKKYPEDPDAYMARAKAYAKSDRNAEAVEDLTKAIAVSKHSYYVAQVTMNRGEVFFKLGEYEKASADFTTVIELGSADAYKPGAFLNRARSRIAEGQFAQARTDANEAIKLYSVLKARNAKKKLGETYNLRAAINCADGKITAARADNSRAASLGAPIAKCGLR